MKKLLLVIALTLASTSSFSHDYKIKDKYGRIVGYADDYKSSLIVKDKYGKEIYEVEDYEVDDIHGNKIYDIEKD